MPLTANRDLDRYVDQELRALPVRAGARIYKGAFLGWNNGHVRPLLAGDSFAGIAYEERDNASGGDGGRAVRVFTMGDFEHVLAGASRTGNRSAVYASADNALTATAAGNSFVGFQLEVCGSNLILLRIQTTPTPLAGGVMTGELVSAGIKHKVVIKASAASMVVGAGDLGGVILVTGTTAGVLVLPAVATAGAGAWCTFIKSGASGLLTIDPSGGELIDGAATHAEMDSNGDSVTVFCDGAGWVVVAKKIA
ncbi:MAG: hypothetical protein KA354_19030 [Phycisphaerae bacterium]|nr:hypothetical protein [Phycisphaerae bacterium]